jgi:hypothetical protein
MYVVFDLLDRRGKFVADFSVTRDAGVRRLALICLCPQTGFQGQQKTDSGDQLGDRSGV